MFDRSLVPYTIAGWIRHWFIRRIWAIGYCCKLADRSSQKFRSPPRIDRHVAFQEDLRMLRDGRSGGLVRWAIGSRQNEAVDIVDIRTEIFCPPNAITSYVHLHSPLLLQAAFLVFFATPARTFIIAPYFL